MPAATPNISERVTALLALSGLRSGDTLQRAGVIHELRRLLESVPVADPRSPAADVIAVRTRAQINRAIAELTEVQNADSAAIVESINRQIAAGDPLPAVDCAVENLSMGRLAG